MTATISLRVTMSALLPFFFFCLVEFSSRSSAIPVAPSPIDNIAPMGSDSGPYSSTRHPDVALWANAAFAYIQNLNCKEVLYMPLPSCMKLQATKSSGIAVHVAMPNPLGKYKASFLNGERLSHSSRHDAVLALDPHPEKRSRHLIMLFFVDEDVDSTICEIKNGVTLGKCPAVAICQPQFALKVRNGTCVLYCHFGAARVSLRMQSWGHILKLAIVNWRWEVDGGARPLC